MSADSTARIEADPPPGSGRGRSAFNPMAGNPLRCRADVERAFVSLLDPLRANFSPGGARVRIDGSGAVFDHVAVELEGFARPLWGLASAAAESSDGAYDRWWEVYRSGLDHGTDPAHPEFWGAVGVVDQRLVELATIGFALAVAGDRLWDPLPQPAKTRVVAYLLAARAQPCSNNNWKFFRILIDLGLRAVGQCADPAPVEAYLDELDGFRVAEGWYRDGPTGQVDHYIGFAFHFYGLLYGKLGGESMRAEALKRRAESFAADFRHWFADDGAALPLGRSLTYRFATAAFWGACAFADVEALPWGAIKGLYLRNLRWWSQHPITRRDGLLTVGYGYPNPLIAEDYNSPCSPYWAFKAFLPLALKDDHPFWAAAETQLDARPVFATLPVPGLLIQHMERETVALASGQSNMRVRSGAEKYAKFAYATHHPLCVEPAGTTLASGSFDNMLALEDERGQWKIREGCVEVVHHECGLWSRWLPWADVTVETWLRWHDRWHVRAHLVRTPRALNSVEGGFAMAREQASATVDARSCVIVGGGALSGIRDASPQPRRAQAQKCQANANLLFPRALVPQLTGAIPAGESWLAAAVLVSNCPAGFDTWLRPPDLGEIMPSSYHSRN